MLRMHLSSDDTALDMDIPPMAQNVLKTDKFVISH